MNRAERARELFESGYNCAQAVFLAFAEDRLGTEEAARLASALGGGLAGTRNTCGAVSGMAMAYGLLRGYSDPAAKEEKQAVYEAVRDMIAEFEEKYGSSVCRVLLGLDDGVRYVAPSDRSGAYYEKRPCAGLCAGAAEILERRLDG